MQCIVKDLEGFDIVESEKFRYMIGRVSKKCHFEYPGVKTIVEVVKSRDNELREEVDGTMMWHKAVRTLHSSSAKINGSP